jgi:hypothetical protein
MAGESDRGIYRAIWDGYFGNLDFPHFAGRKLRGPAGRSEALKILRFYQLHSAIGGLNRFLGKAI